MRGNQTRIMLLVVLLLSGASNGPRLAAADKTPPPEIIESGTAIAVRIMDDIRTSQSDGRIFSGTIDQPVRDTHKNVTIPRGNDVELMARRVSDHEYTLDLESIMAAGRRMAAHADAAKPALVGVIVGALSWSSSGAEIIGAPGAVPRRDVQLATRGKTVKLPAGTLVIFRLEQPLRHGVSDPGFSRNGRHYHTGYGTVADNSSAYEAGMKAGRLDRQRQGATKQPTRAWNGSAPDEYQAGYHRGFNETPAGTGGANTIQIGADNYIRWNGPPASQVYVKVDSERRLFSVDVSGTQPAPWIRFGHKYVFMLVDQNGKEIARDETDLRMRGK